MAAAAESKHSVHKWVERCLEDKHLENVEVDISTGISGEGYLGDIVFATVTGESKTGKSETFHLVFKFGKKNDRFRSLLPVTEVYIQEIHMYTVVFPFCQKFRKSKGLEELSFIPKCYRTFVEYGNELLVFDNLKQLGYRLHDKYQPMDMDHMQLVLEAYGQWHAVSFALQDQNKEEYLRLSAPLEDLFTKMMKNTDAASSITIAANRLREYMQESNEQDLLENFNKVLVRGEIETFFEATTAVSDKTVISHGDCWNNNFMFKYGTDGSRPDKVAVLDWQISYRRSPAYDLSYFIYAVASKKELDQFEKLMDIYYTSLSDNIRRLGSDPDKLFTKEELLEHWRKYSIFGFLMGVMILPIAMCESDDAPDFGDMGADDNFEKLMGTMEIKRKDEYYKRGKAIVEHYTSLPHDI